jgi:hypothetical protein
LNQKTLKESKKKMNKQDITPNNFRKVYEPFRGVEYQYGNYVIEDHADPGGYWKVLHAGVWLRNATYFLEAVDICVRHAKGLV